MVSSPINSLQIEAEKMEAGTHCIFLGSKITADSDCSHEIKRRLLLGSKPRLHTKNQIYHFADKGPFSQSYGFSSSHVRIWELDHKEGWMLNWCFWILVLEKTLDSHLDCREIKLGSPKGNKPWIFIGRTDAKAEAPILWPPNERANSLEKTLMLGKTEGKRRRGWQRMRLLDSITYSMNTNLSKL